MAADLVAEHLLRRHRDRTASRASMFPLAARMIMVLTRERLLIWAAGRRWRPARFLGFVSRDRILQATTRTTGSGWCPLGSRYLQLVFAAAF